MLGRSTTFHAPALARFPVKYFVWIFFPCDIISLILQGVGGSRSASSSGSSQTGVNNAMAGLIFRYHARRLFSAFQRFPSPTVDFHTRTRFASSGCTVLHCFGASCTLCSRSLHLPCVRVE
ncbi:hypothetical protein FB567DRAFT_343229 [Paraphoma chrysanthemicola]|uniref:Uncharacterized protein n=1 Tax=Paraphoma chrysanthemicola TaxID=798071 RepID=A0A8K0R5C0_9PLEO|nr:hypothetical protein FB567DRAFT_343229 [Paraphoma chrysanthemicola]